MIHDSNAKTPLLKYVSRMQHVREQVRRRMRIIQAKQRILYNQKRIPVSYDPGELVLNYTPTRRKGRSEKFMSCYYGPYRVIKRVNALNYVVSSFRKRRGLCQTVHVDRIKRFFLRDDLSSEEAARFSNAVKDSEVTADQGTERPTDPASSSWESVGQTGAMAEEGSESCNDRSVRPSTRQRDVKVRVQINATPRQSPYCLRSDMKRVNYRE